MPRELSARPFPQHSGPDVGCAETAGGRAGEQPLHAPCGQPVGLRPCFMNCPAHAGFHWQVQGELLSVCLSKPAPFCRQCKMLNNKVTGAMFSGSGHALT